MKKELNCIVKGRVQGVMFRDFVQRKAQSLGIVGTVENKMDGSVEVIAMGEEEKLKKFLEFLSKGPFLTRIKLRIDSVEAKFSEPIKNFSDFQIIY